jgi:hypothetical protein
VNLPRLHQLNLLLIIGAFIATLFFNGFDIRFFAFAYILLLGWLFANGIIRRQKPSLALPICGACRINRRPLPLRPVPNIYFTRPASCDFL